MQEVWLKSQSRCQSLSSLLHVDFAFLGAQIAVISKDIMPRVLFEDLRMD